MRKQSKNLKDVLRANVEKVMLTRPGLETPPKLAKRCYWPRGDRKGSLIGARTIGYIFDETAHSPNLDVVEAVGNALEVESWQLLKDGEPKVQPVIPLDVGMLAAAIQAAEEPLQEMGVTITVEEKARLIAAFYANGMKNQRIDSDTIQEMVKLLTGRV